MKIRWMSCTETMILRGGGEVINFVSSIIKLIFIFSKDYLIGEKGGHDQNALDGEQPTLVRLGTFDTYQK